MEEKSEKIYEGYQSTRFKFDPKRKVVWQEISRYLQKWISQEDTVVEIGSGYCDFINSIKSKKKIAIDKFIDPKKFCEGDIKPIFGDFKEINKFENNSIDVFLASNFFEHLDYKEIKECFKSINHKLKSGGRLIIIQPNFRYAYKKYFDDYTHITVWSHESLKDFINVNGLKVVKVLPKFLPLTIKSSLPKTRFLVRAYLNSAIKPFAGQMLLIAKKI